MHDDLGRDFEPFTPRRVVSLVPSITEAVASVDARLLVGATDYCTHPADLSVHRVGGSKYPDVAAILACGPDLVLANAEENRRVDVEAVEAAGVPVWVCYPTTVLEALDSASRMFTDALQVPEPAWVERARRVWAEPAPMIGTAVIPIWRKPWMVLGGATFAGDVLQRLGVYNVFASSDESYPTMNVERILAAQPDLVVLPDEPYRFTVDDGPSFFAPTPARLVNGRHLTWHGPSLAEARDVLAEQLSTDL